MPRNPDNKRLEILLSPAQKAAVEEAAKTAGMSEADFARRALSREARRVQVAMPDDLTPRGAYRRKQPVLVRVHSAPDGSLTVERVDKPPRPHWRRLDNEKVNVRAYLTGAWTATAFEQQRAAIEREIVLVGMEDDGQE